MDDSTKLYRVEIKLVMRPGEPREWAPLSSQGRFMDAYEHMIEEREMTYIESDRFRIAVVDLSVRPIEWKAMTEDEVNQKVTQEGLK